MKNITLCLIAGMFCIISCGPTQVVQPPSDYDAPDAGPEVSYQSFYDDLSPFGRWISNPVYGYVWMPDAGQDFMPYGSNGNWVFTDAGWTWASNYSWGWAPFHYGRWFYEAGYGWMWVPGNEWAPAWVSWREGGDYYGWAPLAPDVSVDVALGSYSPPPNYWNFIPRRYMGNPGWQNYHVDPSRNVTIISNTRIINNYSGTNRTRYAYAPGPDAAAVSRESGSNIRPVPIRDISTPGGRVSGNQFTIYRPRVSAAASGRTDASARPAPARVQNLRDMRSGTQNQNSNPPVPRAPENSRPSAQPVLQSPNNNTGRAAQPPVQNQNNNSRPVLPPPVQPPNNNKPVTQPPVQNRPAAQLPAQSIQVNPHPAVTGRPLQSHFNQRAGNNNNPVQQQNLPQPSPVNRAQMHMRPATATPETRPVPQRQPIRQTAPVQPVNRNQPKPDDKKT